MDSVTYREQSVMFRIALTLNYKAQSRLTGLLLYYKQWVILFIFTNAIISWSAMVRKLPTPGLTIDTELEEPGSNLDPAHHGDGSPDVRMDADLPEDSQGPDLALEVVRV